MKNLWRDKKGTLHKIDKMDKPFLLNAISSSNKNLYQLLEILGDNAKMDEEFAFLQKKVDELEAEYFKRVHKFHDFNKRIPLKKVIALEKQLIKVQANKDFHQIIKNFNMESL